MHMNVHSCAQVLSQPNDLIERVIRQRETGVSANPPLSAAGQEPSILLQPSGGAVKAVSICHLIGASNPHADLGASICYHRQGPFDCVRRNVVVNNRGGTPLESFERSKHG